MRSCTHHTLRNEDFFQLSGEKKRNFDDEENVLQPRAGGTRSSSLPLTLTELAMTHESSNSIVLLCAPPTFCQGY